jgi:DNA-binding transcriptional ArsR family regulator
MTDPLAHVLRRGILAELKSGPLEVAELARRLDVPVENASYHARARATAGLITLDGERQVRGAIAHRYRLEPRAVRGELERARLRVVELESLVA